MNKSILVIDDDPAICSSLEFALGDSFAVITATDPREGLFYFKERDIAATILDLCLGSVDGTTVLREIKRINPRSVVIVLTAYGSIRSSVEAMREGAYYYLTKPVDTSELKSLLQKGMEIHGLHEQIEALSKELRKQHELGGIVGKSKAISHVLALINKVKDIDSNVVITGESGTGKELVARAIHYCGLRQGGPFQVINCAAIPETLLESELFGHAKGAFTGATQRYEGKIKAADGGTVFFDEVGEIPLSLQVKLLRFLQDKNLTPLGSNSSCRVNARVIAATNRDLKRAIQEGSFREDLYYRLCVINIHVPPLRERREDILLLVNHFIMKHSHLLGRPIAGISPEAYKALLGYPYPGNVRELENIIERAVALAHQEEIGRDDLPPELAPADADRGRQARVIPVYLGETLAAVEHRVIKQTLSETRGRQKEAARLLGITDRTLRNKLKRMHGAEKDSSLN